MAWDWILGTFLNEGNPECGVSMNNIHDFVTKEEKQSLKCGSNKSEKEDKILVTNIDGRKVSLGLVHE